MLRLIGASLPRVEALIKLLHATGSCKEGGFRNRETPADGDMAIWGRDDRIETNWLILLETERPGSGQGYSYIEATMDEPPDIRHASGMRTG